MLRSLPIISFVSKLTIASFILYLLPCKSISCVPFVLNVLFIKSILNLSAKILLPRRSLNSVLLFEISCFFLISNKNSSVIPKNFSSNEILLNEEADKLIENDKIIKSAKNVTENNGIVFLDEIDKISARTDRVGGDVSREGVQRDLLPLIEGTTVSTKYGPVKTDHILFIASGAFQLAKPSDLLPELQGRLPIRVELDALNSEDFIRILKEPDNSLIKQYKALLKTENVDLEFTEDGINTIAHIASEVNSSVENIGARRLHTIIERVLDEISFTATDRAGEKITVDGKYIKDNIGELVKDTDLSKFIL